MAQKKKKKKKKKRDHVIQKTFRKKRTQNSPSPPLPRTDPKAADVAEHVRRVRHDREGPRHVPPRGLARHEQRREAPRHEQLARDPPRRRVGRRVQLGVPAHLVGSSSSAGQQHTTTVTDTNININTERGGVKGRRVRAEFVQAPDCRGKQENEKKKKKRKKEKKKREPTCGLGDCL
jgi:hypothetical protein